MTGGWTTDRLSPDTVSTLFKCFSCAHSPQSHTELGCAHLALLQVYGQILPQTANTVQQDRDRAADLTELNTYWLTVDGKGVWKG